MQKAEDVIPSSFMRQSWQSAEWRWNPARGGWRPSFGLPETVVTAEIDLSPVRKEERFDVWRAVATYDAAVELPCGEDRANFEASGFAFMSARGLIAYSRSSGFTARSRLLPAWPGDVTIGLILAGTRSFTDDEGASGVQSAGSFFVYDAALPTRLSWSANSHIYIGIRRAEIVAALCRPVFSASLLATRLAANPLAGLLRIQLVWLAEHALSLPQEERGFVFGQTLDLVIAMLRQQGAENEDGSEHGRIWLLATAHIASAIAAPGLEAEAIAHAVGCSRATLYRVFAEHGVSVSEMVRQARLARAERLLLSEPSLAIAAIAYRCGLQQARTFNRIFKQAHGMTPTDWRREHR